MKAVEVWTETIPLLEKRVGKEAFDMWFQPVTIEAMIGNEVCLVTPSRFIAERLKDHYSTIILECLREIAQEKDLSLRFIVREETVGDPTPPHQPPRPHTSPNPRYTFESFVSGASNQFALATAQRVAERPGDTYNNPLFIYGDSGLGKTHLLHAIGNAIPRKHPTQRVIYTTGEQFMNEVVSSIRHDRMRDFKNRYRTVDVLLVDDIQIIAGGTATKEEFFHTFNVLYEEKRQIVITSDKPPRELVNLKIVEERLGSRFEMGLMADIQPPDLETRMAILKKKADVRGLRLPDAVIEFIASSIRSNVRELEGVLNELEVVSSVRGSEITLALTKERLQGRIAKRKVVTADDIQRVVAEHFHLRLADLRAKLRTKSLVYPRHLAMYLCRHLTQLSLPDIGRQFGGKDHSTVIHAIRKIAKKAEADPKVRALLDDLTKQVEG